MPKPQKVTKRVSGVIPLRKWEDIENLNLSFVSRKNRVGIDNLKTMGYKLIQATLFYTITKKKK